MPADGTPIVEPPTGPAATGPAATGPAIGPTAPSEEQRDGLRRTWPQRLTIAGVFLAALGCFGAGSGLYAAQQVIEDRNLIALDTSAQSPGNDPAFSSTTGTSDGVDEPGVTVDATTAPVETFPDAEPDAQNFLVTGADNNSCIDPSSPYAGAFGDRTSFGERSDTIMMWRVNPATSQVAVLSFPRDLWVSISGRSSSQRINSAYERDQPQRLIDTIYENFGVPTDHFVQVDFCAFRTLVDAVGGVAVPFDYPVKDPSTGLNVEAAGCYTFSGDHALAYVRSRKLEYLDVDGNWKKDGTSDLGRISRQQDFIRRTVDSLLAAGTFDPAVIRALIQTSDDYVKYDAGLTPNKILEFAGVLKNIDPAAITTYQIEARGTNIQGASVLIPQIDGANMQSVLAVFRGTATLAGAPEQVFEPGATTTTVVPSAGGDSGTDTIIELDPSVTSPATTSPGASVDSPPVSTLPIVEAEVNSKGIFPDPNVAC